LIGTAGCAPGEAEVQFTVSVESAFDEEVQGPVIVSFFENKGGYPNRELETLDTLEFPSVGKKTHKMKLEEPLPDIVVRGLEDTDGDGRCSPGELWAEEGARIGHSSLDDESLGSLVILKLSAVSECPDS
jgi:hypothetical protein